jgi:2-polyprenyl-6-methoxyphenol hydroxylase-like FAD-dependent oxidoreductase
LRNFDLVIGADGLHSAVRQLSFGEDQRYLKSLGVGLAIYTIPNILNLQDWQLAFRDSTNGFVVYPARNNRELRVNFAFSMPPEDDIRGDFGAQKAIVMKHCRQLGGPVPYLLEALEDAMDFYFGSLSLVRMTAWSSGRVGLVGDAAYCPSPFSGQGSSMALVGAFVLARELARSPASYADAFARYEARMRPYVLVNQEMVVVDRGGPIPDQEMDRAKNWIEIDDLLNA